MKELKAKLQANPGIKKVWINKKGEWLFVKRKGFEEKSRDEVLAMDDEAGAGTGTSKAAGPKKAADVIELINAAETAEAVDALIVDDTRATVLAAADAKKKSFVS